MAGLLAAVEELEYSDAKDVLPDVVTGLEQGTVIPYVGPGLATLSEASVPVTPEELAEFFQSHVSLPARARGNAWAAAQFIESRRHRNTVTALMTEAFSAPVVPSELHKVLAGFHLPMIVDVWYDGAMRQALSDAGSSWGEIQGISRAGLAENRWYRFYGAEGQEASGAEAAGWQTILYKPHGGVVPSQNYLISDSDYVEVLTEIDIQTPIPDVVVDRRMDRNFLFLGCRFHDQMLRTYARQIMKRSGGQHVAVFEPCTLLTRNEIRFLVSEGITPVISPLSEVLETLRAVV